MVVISYDVGHLCHLMFTMTVLCSVFIWSSITLYIIIYYYYCFNA